MSLIEETSIGVVGIGMLGSAIIERFLNSGLRVNVFGRNKRKLALLNENGATIFDSARSLAEKSDFIITCVTNYESLQDVLFSIEGISKGNNKNVTVIDCTTITAEQSLWCADKMKVDKGLKFMSVPVMGGPTDARHGELISLVSGNEETYRKIYPILERFSKKIFYLGNNNGISNNVKLALNLNIALITLALSEGLILANRSGIDPKLYLEILNLTKLKTGISERKGNMMIKNDYSPSFFLKNMLKDIDLVMEMSNSLQLILPMTSMSQQLFRAVNKREDRQELDYSVIHAFLQELNTYQKK
ncbi:MAG TPA: NAD(P)-dependent oxidoreductase [Nitrososphaeraceae archaeon]|nr:NAD(P)-dependent oxidoreductase [Nitrososphaeraceae archaeon]